MQQRGALTKALPIQEQEDKEEFWEENQGGEVYRFLICDMNREKP